MLTLEVMLQSGVLNHETAYVEFCKPSFYDHRCVGFCRGGGGGWELGSIGLKETKNIRHY